MQFKLSESELSFMRYAVMTMRQIAQDNDVDSFYYDMKMVKLQKKFAPNSAVVHLHPWERKLCGDVCGAWLTGAGSLATDAKTEEVRTLQAKLMEGNRQ